MTSTEIQSRAYATTATGARPQWRSALVVLLFTLTAFLGAGLLFVVQPMVARLVLPSYGGSATVWSTSSLFFQVLLLIGYLYTHAATQRLGPRWQPPVHLLVLLAPLLMLPIALPYDAAPQAGASPVLWLLRALVLMVGLPFLVVATTGPLLQRWYSWTGGPRAKDPYFLFASSNLGSFGGLLVYPFLVEPSLTLQEQRTWWSWGFVAFVLLTSSCGLVTLMAGRSSARGAETAVVLRASALGWGRIGRWTMLAFLPSAMMLAVTAHVSTDIAAIPLLWVVPLAIYLGTFVAAFARTSRRVPAWLTRAAVATTVLAAAVMPTSQVLPATLTIGIQMVMLAVVGYAAHAQLAAERPEVLQLTAFYLVVAVGGALGGLLNGMLAPLIFDRVWEYPLVLAAVPLILIPVAGLKGALATYAARGWVSKVVAGLAGVIVVSSLSLGIGASSSQVGAVLLLVTLVLAAGWLLSSGRMLVAVALAVLLVLVSVGASSGAIDHRRTFFGSYRVGESVDRHTLAHGTTLHGSQWRDERRLEPTTYFARSGPLGAVFSATKLQDVGIVGLGVGTIAAYGEAGQTFHFVEIDPEVVAIARDPHFFTYLRDSKARVEVTVGDGRLEIAKLAPGSLDLLILDAFSSDAVPIHLLTVDAMRMYTERLRPGGLLVINISNRVVDLRPVLRGAADQLGWTAVWGSGGDAGGTDGATPSHWVVMAANPANVASLATRPGWEPLPARSVTWTDDYSSLLSVLR